MKSNKKNIWKNKTVVVCGASGFIGSNMVTILLSKGANVTAVVSPKKGFKKLQKTQKDIGMHIKILEADLLDLKSCIKILRGQEVLLNFAAIDGGTNFKKKYPVEIFNSNTGIVRNLLEASVKNKLKKVLLMSSSEIYSPQLKGTIKEEDGFTGMPGEVTQGYAWSKRTTEILAKLYAQEFGLQVAIARPSNVYGPHDYTDSEKGRVIPTFIRQALNNEDITIWGNGLMKKSFLFVEDLNHALLDLVADYSLCDPVNLASDRQVSIKQLARLIIKLTKSKSKIKYVKTPFVKMDTRIISTKKAKRLISFKENYSIESGILSVVQSIKKIT